MSIRILIDFKTYFIIFSALAKNYADVQVSCVHKNKDYHMKSFWCLPPEFDLLLMSSLLTVLRRTTRSGKSSNAGEIVFSLQTLVARSFNLIYVPTTNCFLRCLWANYVLSKDSTVLRWKSGLILCLSYYRQNQPRLKFICECLIRVINLPKTCEVNK